MTLDLLPLVVPPLLLFARVGGMTMMLPMLGDDSVPMRIRLMIGFGLSAALTGLLGPRLPPDAPAMLVSLALSETLVGLALGAVVRLLFSAVHMAGAIAALQIGLTAVLVPDQGAGGMSTALSRLLSLAALLVCLAAQLHHLWIASLVESYTRFPPGQLTAAGDTALFAELALRTLSDAMRLAIALAAPFLFYALLYNLALGIAARLAPAIQIYFIAQPLNLMLGLGLTGLVLAMLLGTFSDAMAAFVQQGWRG